MRKGTAVAAAICFIYWLVLLLYSGIHVGFMMFWLVAAILLGSFSAWKFMQERRKTQIQIPLWIKVPIYTTVMFILVGFIVSEIFIVSGMIETPPKSLDYLIVLGNHEYNENKNEIVTQRLDKAIGYLKENNNTMVIVSGGVREDSYISQAKVMYDYLVLQGISSSRIIMERRSEDTAQSIYYSRLLIEDNSSVGIVTSNYNCYRAVGMAEQAGITPVYGISSTIDWVLLPDMMMREFFMVFIEKIRGNL